MLVAESHDRSIEGNSKCRPWRRGILRPLIDGKIDDASWPAVE